MQGGIANCYAALLFLCHSIVFVLFLFQFPDEAPYGLDFLSAVAAGLVRCIKDNLLYKLVDNRRHLFGNCHILPNNRHKTVQVRFVLLVGMYHFPACLDVPRQFFLLRFIFSGQLQKPFVRNRARYIILIDTIENSVKFRNPLFVLGDFPLP